VSRSRKLSEIRAPSASAAPPRWARRAAWCSFSTVRYRSVSASGGAAQASLDMRFTQNRLAIDASSLMSVADFYSEGYHLTGSRQETTFPGGERPIVIHGLQEEGRLTGLGVFGGQRNGTSRREQLEMRRVSGFPVERIRPGTCTQPHCTQFPCTYPKFAALNNRVKAPSD
jgi:hypothetical protein